MSASGIRIWIRRRFRARGALGLKCGVLLVVMILLSAEGAAAELPEGRGVRVGIFQNEPVVFENEQGVAQGLYVDLLNEMAAEENWNLTYVLDTWAGCLERLRRGDIDLMVCIARTPERELYADYSHQVVWTLWGVVFAHPRSGIEDVLTLTGKRVAVLKDGINGINFGKLCTAFDVECRIIEMSSHAASLEAVEVGKVDAAVVNSVFGTMHGAEYDVNRTSIVFSPVKAYFAAPKGKNGDLLATIDGYLGRWKEDKQSIYYQSIKRWLMTHHEHVMMTPHWVMWTLLALAVIIILAVVWVRLLRHSVRIRTEELTASESNFRSFYENAPYGIIVCELLMGDNGEPADFVHVQANQATAIHTGFELNDIVGKRASEMVSAEELARLLETYGGVVQTGESASYAQYFPIYDRTVEVTAFPLSGRRFIINFFDISARVRAENELVAHRERLTDLVEERTAELKKVTAELKMILDSVRATIWYKDTHNRILRVNKATADSVGMRVEDIEGKTTEELFPRDAQRYYQDDLEVIHSRKPKLGIVEPLRVASGELRWVLTDKIPVQDEEGNVTGLVALALDITERKKADEQLERRTEELRAIVKAMVGRENRMVDLKKVIGRLRHQLEQAGLTPHADDPLFGESSVENASDSDSEEKDHA